MRALKLLGWALKRAKSKNMNLRLTSVAQKRLYCSLFQALGSRGRAKTRAREKMRED